MHSRSPPGSQSLDDLGRPVNVPISKCPNYLFIFVSAMEAVLGVYDNYIGCIGTNFGKIWQHLGISMDIHGYPGTN